MKQKTSHKQEVFDLAQKIFSGEISTFHTLLILGTKWRLPHPIFVSLESQEGCYSDH